MYLDQVLNDEVIRLRVVIETFIHERRDKKLEALEEGDTEKQQKIMLQYQRETWLEDAAKRVSQIQLVTHALKFTHPSAKGTSIYLAPSDVSPQAILVGTHNITLQRNDDVVGNAAGLDVYKFLKLEYQGISLLNRALVKDPVLLKALSDNSELAKKWCTSFSEITNGDGRPTSHRLAKQLYFPLKEEGSYHLLAPLFPTSLVQTVYNRLQEDRFGENTKAAREARKNGKALQGIKRYCEYPDLAVQKFGGTKPQNISQLNSERGGQNWLFSSCPPTWRSESVRPPLNIKAVFSSWFGRRQSVRKKIKKLGSFLKGTDHNNVHIRQARADMVNQIVDELLQVASEIHMLDAGWSIDANCRLDLCETLWLDPKRADQDEDFAKERAKMDWPDEVCDRFAKWFNHELRRFELPVGDSEHVEWERVLAAEFRMLRMELDNYE